MIRSTRISAASVSDRWSVAGVCMFIGVTVLVAATAIVTKQLTSASAPALMSVSSNETDDQPGPQPYDTDPDAPAWDTTDASTNLPIHDPLLDDAPATQAEAAPPPVVQLPPPVDHSLRWFNGRPVRPVRTITMLVTAYSPDAISCGPSADGTTASLHNVGTNAYCLVAADSRVLPLGSMVSVPGYDSANVVPVLDRGGKIKGNHIDLLFPTDAQARAWGVKHLKITVWEYADGKGREDWRKIRDSK